MAFWNKGKTNSNMGANPLGGLIQRMWSRAPTKDKSQYPAMVHTSPRLDPVVVISKAVAVTDWRLFDKRDIRKSGDSAEPIIDHELYDLLDNPIKRYPEIDWYALCYLGTALTNLVGEFFIIKIRDDSGRVIELDPIPPAWVTWTPTINNPTFNVYPFGVTAGKVLVVPADDMIWFKHPDMSDPYGRGRGSAEALEDEVESDELFAKLGKNFAYNDATPPFAVTAPGATPESIQQIKQDWMQKLGGWMNRRVPAFLPWDAKIQQLAMSPVEMDMMESRKFIRDEVRQHFQIPPEIFGNIENSNRSTIDSSFYLFNKNVLSYEFRFWERVLDRQLIQCEFDKNLCFKFQEEVPEDEAFKLQVLQTGLTAGAVKVDEFRTAFKLPALPNGKGQVFLRTFSTYEVPADGSDTPEPPKPSGQTTDKPSDDENSEASIAEDMGIDADESKGLVFEIVDKSIEHEEIEIEITNNKAPDPRKVAIWKAFDARATAKEGEFIEAVKKFSKKQKAIVVEYLSSEKLSQAINNNNGYSEIIGSILGEVFTDDSSKALKSALAPAWMSSMKSGREHFYDLMGVDLEKSIKAPRISPDFSVTNRLFNAYIEEMGLLKAEGINDTTNEKLRNKLINAISNGIFNGDTLNSIKNAILDVCDGVYDEMDSTRAKLIAVTETAASVNAGSFMTAKSEGMTQKQWLSVNDDRCRGNNPDDEFSHVNADGEIVGINEDFVMTGEAMAYPLDPKGSAGNVCRCRCTCLWGNEDIPLGEDNG